MDDAAVSNVQAPMQGTVVDLPVAPGAAVAAGAVVAVLESMKMHHDVTAPAAGVVRAVTVDLGDTVAPGQVLVEIGPPAAGAGPAPDAAPASGGLGGPGGGPPAAAPEVRADLARVLERRRRTLDEARPRAVDKRHSRGMRTARENVAALVDPDSFVEYGGLAIASQRRRRPVEELIAETPADGIVTGVGTVNADLFGAEAARCAVAAYDYTVLAGTQGHQGHRKKDRLFELAAHRRLPVVLFAEGGGGRPGDTDVPAVSSLDTEAFARFAGLSGLVPVVGITAGRSFAGNAALLGCCDVIIATEGSSTGMAGPAMIEGGGLGVVGPDDIGPLDVHVASGVVDVAVADEAEATDVARRYLGYFQGRLPDFDEPDQTTLRDAVPAERVRVYDVRAVVHTLADTGSVLELRRGFAPGIVTALARIEGRPVGVVANDPRHLGGAVDSDGADKVTRFWQLCDAFDLPIVTLVDTPGFMVGPDAERTAQVRHFGRMFVTAASLTVPVVAVVLRKAYGLGAQAMAAGHLHAPVLTVSWPTGELGGMGLEGAVRLGFRRELDAIADPAERQATYDRRVADMYERGSALNVATYFELDDVIDPADARGAVARALATTPTPEGWQRRATKKRPCVDTW
ncbi:MAG TPA: carboxyl transferase domain-containing protein [Acidimicrobiales bacterium]|nr:carboxyl transferase domain-containing protein [Acidimicrobiales bacterium]